MSEICKELAEHAAHCKACGQFTTAAILLHAREWINIQQSTIIQQRKQIAEMQEQTEGFRMKFKGGANQTSYSKKEPA